MRVRYILVELSLEQILGLLVDDIGVALDLGEAFIDVDSSTMEGDHISLAIAVRSE